MAVGTRFLFPAIVLIFTSITVVAACGSSAKPAESSSQSSQPPTAAAQPSAAPAQVSAPISASSSSSTPQPLAFLQVTSPSDDITVNTPTFTVAGIARPGAVVSVNGDLVSVGPTGNFSVNIKLDAGPNDVEVEASDTKGNDETVLRSVIYAP